MNQTDSKQYAWLPTKQDVLCGRGLTAFRHEANQALRTIIVRHLEDYLAATRSGKTVLIESIIESITEKGGRFLLHDKKVGMWYDGGMQAAKNRVGAAFRDAKKASKGKGKCTKEMRALTKRRSPLSTLEQTKNSPSSPERQTTSSQEQQQQEDTLPASTSVPSVSNTKQHGTNESPTNSVEIGDCDRSIASSSDQSLVDFFPSETHHENQCLQEALDEFICINDESLGIDGEDTKMCDTACDLVRELGWSSSSSTSSLLDITSCSLNKKAAPLLQNSKFGSSSGGSLTAVDMGYSRLYNNIVQNDDDGEIEMSLLRELLFL